MAYRKSARRMSKKAGRASRKGGLKRGRRATRKGGLKRGGLSRRVKRVGGNYNSGQGSFGIPSSWNNPPTESQDSGDIKSGNTTCVRGYCWHT